MWQWAQRVDRKVERRHLALAAILGLALFMRFWHLASLPPGLHPDESANGLDILRILHHHWITPFSPTNGGRETLFFYLQAIFVGLFGNTTLSLRIAPALIGTAAVGATYLWASSWFNRRVGLLAALFMAVTPWAVIISRDGFRAGMVALLVPLTLWLLTKAMRSGERWWYVAAGVSLGAGFYTYTAFRLFPLVLLALLVYLMVWRRPLIRGRQSGLLLSALVTLIVIAPITIYGLNHPGEVFGRASGVSFTNPDLNHGRPLQSLLTTIGKTLLMFNFKGDLNYRQNLGGQPELNMFTGVMFVLGLLLSFVNRRRAAYVALLGTFFIMMLPELLTAEGIPHAMRAIGALPAAMVLAAVGTEYLLAQWLRVFPLNTLARMAGTSAIAALLALTVYQGYVEYFVTWANSAQTYQAYSEDTTQLAAYFNATPVKGVRYAVAGQYSMMPVAYLTSGHSHYTRIDVSEIATAPVPAGQPAEFSVLEGSRVAAIQDLKQRFPKGRVSPHYSAFSGQELFVIYEVPAG